MKKLVLSILTLSFMQMAAAQIVVRGISPAPIANNYNFTWADPAGGDWGTPDLNIPGTFVQGEIMLVDDGSTGINPQGHPVSAEGCNTLLNNFGGIVSTLSVLDGGSGYSTATGVATTQGNGSGLTLNLNVNQSVDSLNSSSLNPGSGYSTTTNLGTTSNGSGTGLTVDITAETIGKVLLIDNTNMGVGGGYVNSNGVATSTSGSGTGLTLDVTASPIVDSVVLSLNPASLNPGFSYTSGTNLSTTNSGTGTGLTVDVTAETIGKALKISNVEGVNSGYVSSIGIATTTNNSGTGLTLDVTATPIVDSVISLDPTSLTAGSFYTSGIDVPTTNSGTGTGTGLTVDITAETIGKVLTISNVEGDNGGYISAPGVATNTNNSGNGLTLDVTATPIVDSVKTLNILSSGTNYINSIGVETVPQTGNGFGLTVDITASPIIDSVVIKLDTISSLVPGSNYIDSIGANTSTNGFGTGLTVDIVTDAGTISHISINDPGSGYDVGDTIYIEGGNQDASVIVELIGEIGGNVTSVIVNNGGSGYAVGDTITISGGQNGTIKVASIGSTGGNITSLTINEAGAGYTVGDTIEIAGGTAYVLVNSVSAGQILSVQLNNPGSGYAVGDLINIVGGQNGSITVDSIGVSGGNITSLTINNAGAGYTVGDTINIAGGSAYVLVDSVSVGQIVSVQLNNGGSGYAVGDSIIISGGQNGSIKVASIGEAGGNITSLTINNPGVGYNDGDTINISGGSAYVLVDSVSAGQILSLQLNNPGSGYNIGDTIYVNNGQSGSIVVQTVTNTISSVTVQNPGSGYTVGDTIVVSTGNGDALVKVEGLKPIIAVIYRNNCEFGLKALNAQNAGAVGAIIINRDPEVIEMGGGASGVDVTIPVVMLSSIDGATLVDEMNNGPVEVFIGNKQNLLANDGGANREQALISRYGSVPLAMANNNYTFGVGLQMYNFGTNDNTFTVTAEIKDPNGVSVYNEQVEAPILSGDTLAIFSGNPIEFPDYTMTNAEVGEYTLTYTISIVGATDDSDYDNVITSTFNVTNDVLSLARQNSETGKVLVNSFPSNATSSYQACMRLQDIYPTSTTGIEGLYFSVNASNDTILDEAITAEIFEWNDGWIDASGGWNTITFDDLNPIGVIDYVCESNADNEKVVYAPFSAPILLNDDQRYLVCLTTYNPEVGFGFDNGITYDGNYGIYVQPISPVYIDATTWYSGWSGVSAFSLGIKLIDNVGVSTLNSIDGVAYPNPANDVVTVSVESSGNAQLIISDISGKKAYSGSINLINGKADVNISKLDSGIYVFNISLENGKTSQFNVVKK